MIRLEPEEGEGEGKNHSKVGTRWVRQLRLLFVSLVQLSVYEIDIGKLDSINALILNLYKYQCSQFEPLQKDSFP